MLKDCIARAGSIEGGLKYYVGATTSTDGGYGAKVLAERARLRQLIGVRSAPANADKPAEKPPAEHLAPTEKLEANNGPHNA
ncbi:hypothetical protein D3C72_2273540 [compost metagenome]